MPLGELLTSWTIRIALACYAAAWAVRISGPASQRRWRWWRWLSTLGCAAFAGHVIAAFEFYHHWSHSHAVADTARQTREMIGLEFGEGIFFSYAFGVAWLLDVAWSWLAPDSYRRQRLAATVALHGYLIFIALNGAAVFKSGPIRWITLAVAVALAAWAIWRRNSHRAVRLL